MKICFLAAANSIHSYRWIKYFSESGHSVVWISLAESIFDPIESIEYHEVKGGKGFFGLALQAITIRSIIKQVQPDVLHVHSVGTYGFMALFAGSKKIVATPWGSDVIYGKNSFFKKPVIALLLRKANVVTCDAWHMMEEVLELGVPKKKIYIINFGIDTNRFCPLPVSWEIRDKYQLGNSPVVFSLRNFEPVYDIPTLLRAIPIVLKSHPQTLFMLIGHGSLEKELKRLAVDLGIEGAVRFIGFVPNLQLPTTLCSLDVYVSTSLSDAGIAASTAEAMACGIPVIVTDSGENLRWIENGNNGYIFPTSSSENLANCISVLLMDDKLRKKIGLAGRLTIKEKNDYFNEMNKMNYIYRQLE